MSPICIHIPVWYFCKGFSFFPRWDMISWLLVIFKGLLIWFLRGFQETKAGDMWMSLKPWTFHRFFPWRTSWIKMLRRFGTNFVLGRSDTQSWVLRNGAELRNLFLSLVLTWRLATPETKSPSEVQTFYGVEDMIVTLAAENERASVFTQAVLSKRMGSHGARRCFEFLQLVMWPLQCSPPTVKAVVLVAEAIRLYIRHPTQKKPYEKYKQS